MCNSTANLIRVPPGGQCITKNSNYRKVTLQIALRWRYQVAQPWNASRSGIDFSSGIFLKPLGIPVMHCYVTTQIAVNVTLHITIAYYSFLYK
jgi:hypothetical protein